MPRNSPRLHGQVGRQQGHRKLREDSERHHQEKLRRHSRSGGSSQTSDLLPFCKVHFISFFFDRTKIGKFVLFSEIDNLLEFYFEQGGT